jgi:hypothetical protein
MKTLSQIREEALLNEGGHYKRPWNWMHAPILPIGAVNLKTGANALFGVIWHGWTENEGVNYVFKTTGAGLSRSDKEGKIRVVHSAEPLESAVNSKPVGHKEGQKHDQTGRDFGQAEIIGHFPHTKEGLLEIAKLIGKNSALFYTYK